MRVIKAAFAGACLSGCSLIVNTDCFQGECVSDAGDATLDVTLDVRSDAAPEGAVDAAGMDVEAEAADPCAFTTDPCRNIVKPYGGCYCGSSTQSGFDTSHANTTCLYRCNDSLTPAYTDKTHLCPSGCVVASSGFADYCSGQPCDGSTGYCNGYCGGP